MQGWKTIFIIEFGIKCLNAINRITENNISFYLILTQTVLSLYKKDFLSNLKLHVTYNYTTLSQRVLSCWKDICIYYIHKSDVSDQKIY